MMEPNNRSKHWLEDLKDKKEAEVMVCEPCGKNLDEQVSAACKECYVAKVEENKQLREENEILKYRSAELEQCLESIEHTAQWEGGGE